MCVRSALEEKLVQDRAGGRSESDPGARLFRRFPQGGFQDRLDYRGHHSLGRVDRENLGHHRGRRSLDLAEPENRDFQDPHLQDRAADRAADREHPGYRGRHSPDRAADWEN